MIKQSWELSERRSRREKNINKDTMIRISFAYLYRIKINDKYLLIKSSRNTGKYQPIGGVYKYNDDEKDYLSKNYHIESDDKIKNDKTSKNDYRFYMKDKYIKEFVKHFETDISNRENENDITREFIEEVFEDSSVDPKSMGVINYSFTSRFIEFSYQSIYRCYEFVLADIYEFKLDSNQEKILNKIIYKNNKFLLATQKDIETRGIKLSKRGNEDIISNNSWKILASKADEATYSFNNKNFNVDLTKKK